MEILERKAKRRRKREGESGIPKEKVERATARKLERVITEVSRAQEKDREPELKIFVNGGEVRDLEERYGKAG